MSISEIKKPKEVSALFFLNLDQEGANGFQESNVFRFLLVNIGAFFEYIGVKGGFEFRFEKLFGFEPPDSHDISSKAQKKVRARIIRTAKQALRAQKRLEEGDYEKFYYPSVDDFQNSSAWDKIPPPLLERNKKKGNYEKMKESAEKAGFCVLEDPKLQELDQKVQETKFSFADQDTVPKK